MKIIDFFEKKAYLNENYVYIIAEVSQNHDGSLGQAHAFIDACADCGVDAIKFQTHIAEAESTPDEPFRVKFSYEDDTRYDYWKRMEFTKEQWAGLKKHAEDRGLEFLSSPFSVEAFEMLDELGVSAWKLGSGEVFNSFLMDKMIHTNKPILLSSGMSTYDEIKKQSKKILESGSLCAVFQCTTAYPNPLDTVGLNVISELLSWNLFPVGLSDHSGKIYPMLAASTLGARLLETHVTMSPYMFGPDVSSSLTIEKLRELVEGTRDISYILSHKVDKNELTDNQVSLRKIFSKGLYAAVDMQKGTVLNEDNLYMKKPLIGVSAEDYMNVFGKEISKDISAGEAIKWEYIKK